MTSWCGESVAVIASSTGITNQTLYNWHSQWL